MVPPPRLPAVGSAKGPVDKDDQRQPAIILEDSEQYPSLSQALAADPTLRAVLIMTVSFVCVLAVVLALLVAPLLWLLLQVFFDLAEAEAAVNAISSLSAQVFYYLVPALASLEAFMAVRAFCVLRKIRSASATLEAATRSGKKDTAPDLSKLSAVSYLYILGSGGHTGEMIDLIKLSFKANKNAHRRYIISRGDSTSVATKRTLENLIQENCSDGTAGTHDSLLVTRVRDVGDPYYLLPLTAQRSALDVLVALTSVPAQRADQPNARDFKYPHVIVTNGPGTGFIVGFVAFLLKIVWLAPQNRLKVIYFESWARTDKPGLTGRLFHRFSLAHLFAVQNDQLSQVIDKPNIGNISARYAALPNPISKK